VAYLWFEASPYTGIGYKNGLAEGGHKTTATKKYLNKTEKQKKQALTYK
jgi:hypothetical protein